MTKHIFARLTLMSMCGSLATAAADAQVTFTTPSNEAAQAPRPLRERGPALEPALLAAQTAVETCEARGYQVTVAVVDSAGLPVVLLSGNGAAAITQSIAMGKAVSAMRNGKPSAELAVLARTDKELAARLAADPQQGPQRGGGIPILSGSTVIGAIAVSGSPDAGWDVECAQAGLAKALAKRTK
ncbi:MAG: heme-binding protein [Sphingobium sp.]|nr:heme-binding protein [Sphingobium sp.]